MGNLIFSSHLFVIMYYYVIIYAVIFICCIYFSYIKMLLIPLAHVNSGAVGVFNPLSFTKTFFWQCNSWN